MYRNALKTIRGMTGGKSETKKDDLLHFNSNLYDITEQFYKTYAAISGNAMKKQHDVMEGGNATCKKQDGGDFAELMAQLKELENTFTKRFDMLEEKINELKQQYKTTGGLNEIDKVIDEIGEDKNEDLENHKEETDTDKDLKNLDEETDTDKDLKNLDEETDDSDKDLKNLDEETDDSDKDLKNLDEETDDSDKDLKNLDEENDDSDKDLKNLESEDNSETDDSEDSSDDSDDSDDSDVDTDLNNLDGMTGGADLSSILSNLGNKYTESFKTKSTLSGGNYGETKKMNKYFPY